MSVEAGPVGVSTAAVSGNTKSSQEEIRIAQRRLASMRNYWVQLGQIVHDDSVGVWKQLENDSTNCKMMLQKRAQSIAEVDELTRRNAELKSLLNSYLGDNVTNAAFRVPPAQVRILFLLHMFILHVFIMFLSASRRYFYIFMPLLLLDLSSIKAYAVKFRVYYTTTWYISNNFSMSVYTLLCVICR